MLDKTNGFISSLEGMATIILKHEKNPLFYQREIGHLFSLCLYAFFPQSEDDEAALNKKRSKKATKKFRERQKKARVEPLLEEQFLTGRILGKIFFLRWF